MGVDHEVYVILATKYMELVRPHLIKNYGRIDFDSIIREEARRRQNVDFIESIENQDFSFIFESPLAAKKNIKWPLSKFRNSKQAKSYKGDYQESVNIRSILQKESVFIDEQRNHFLRLDQFLGTIDRFGEHSIKVCNHLNIENFLTYIAVIKDARQKEVDSLKQAGLLKSKPTKKKVEPQTITEEVSKSEPQKEDKENSRDDSDEDSDSGSEPPKKKVKPTEEVSKSEPRKEDKENSVEDSNEGPQSKHPNENEEKPETISEEDDQSEPDDNYREQNLNAKRVYYAERMFKQAYQVMKNSKEQMYLVFRSI